MCPKHRISLYILSMDIFFERYAEAILKQALRLRAGDVLSINTEECNSAFAHILSDMARSITGNGSYIQLIENGKVIDTEEASTDFPIEKKPTVLLYLPTYKNYEEPDFDKIYSAKELQAFRLLSEPLFNPPPALPFLSAPCPNESWARMLDEDSSEALVANIISDLLSLGEDDFLDIYRSNQEILEYEKDKLNDIKLKRGRIFSEEGTDLSFSFLDGSEFATSSFTTTGNRSFVPTVFASDIYRALDTTSLNGYLNISRPIMLFGKKISNLSVTFENGSITDYVTDEYSAKLFDLFLRQDPLARKASMLSIVEDTCSASYIENFLLPEWDRMRASAIVLGGPRPEGIDEMVREKCPDCLVTLYLPIGNDSLTIISEDASGNEYTIVEDGIIQEE